VGNTLAEELNTYHLPGVVFEPIEFTPTDIANVTTDPKYDSQKCGGIFIKVTDRNTFEPVRTGIHILYGLRRLYRDDFKWRGSRSGGALYIDKLTGTAKVREMIDGGAKPDEIINEWQDGLNKFTSVRERHLLYK
jgi:beta-N-acetylhexosaminidase